MPKFSVKKTNDEVFNYLCEFIDQECDDYTLFAGCEPLRKGQYGYIPVKGYDFMFLLAVAMKATKGKKFIDAGCGPGFTLKMAKACGLEAEGVEINPKHVKYAINQKLKVHAADMNKFDFRPYDIVYSYVPLMGGAFGKWSEEVSFEAKPGTVFIAPTFTAAWVLPKNGKFETVYQDDKVPGTIIKKIAA